ncbi:MAG: ATP-binding protein [Synergistaceae bacterium]|nr:ATP-binding protein [Synergistaceae bacterium]
MEDNEILNTLRANNPFVSSASPLPWENKNPDLLQLSREASEDIEQLMRHKRREPSVPLAGLILGEAGAGKTHMLTRILRHLRGSSVRAVFVAVKTFRDPKSVTKHLLDEIFISLKRIHSQGKTQFDVIMSDFVAAYEEHRRQEDYPLDIRSQIAKDIPSLERNFLKCFISYLSANDAATKNDLLDWLSEGLEGEDAMRLGLPERDLNSLSDSRREQESEKVLIALGQILAYSKVLMIVCFDQMDAMKDRELISAWGNIINLLMNDLSGILPLCFVRSEIWNDVFMPVLDDAVVSRLRNNTMIMRTCTLNQAKLLIQAKIENSFGKDSKEIFDWLIARMGNSLRDGYSPRSVIELANHAITATGTINIDTETPAVLKIENEDEEIIATIKKAYDDEYKKVETESELWPPNAEHLNLALEIWLKSFDGFEFQKSDIKNMKLIGKYHGKNFAFIIVIGKSHFVVTAGLNRGTDFLAEHQGAFCCYVSEKKVHKPTWKKANEAMKIFKKSGGRVLMLDDKNRIRWYALTALINRIDNGDVNLYLKSGNRPATRGDIKKFARENISLVDFPFDSNANENEFEIKIQSEVNDTLVFNILNEMLNASPMKMLSVKKAAELLGQRGINMTSKKLFSFLKREKATFKTYKNEDDDPIVTL